jgi:hypothetical protein
MKDYKQLNLSLENGLCVLGAKPKKGSVLTLFITDFITGCRVLFCKESKKIIGGNVEISFSERDIKQLVEKLA